ncbi:hypothetical protein PR048_027894 [Dryococelus australis]|uniref:Uncharacterized protein n=1 Tax=Dryococelus australis TaxID=614101 RepID=A0ABQ9GHT2_9NEOP|nr:hypothetical protein PR048_027894 [Dryococelus australis]
MRKAEDGQGQKDDIKVLPECGGLHDVSISPANPITAVSGCAETKEIHQHLSKQQQLLVNNMNPMLADNATPHMAKITKQKLNDLRGRLFIVHSPHSQDLGPTTIYEVLFRNLHNIKLHNYYQFPERLAHTPFIKAYRGCIPDRVTGFLQVGIVPDDDVGRLGPPISPAPSFRHRSILPSITLIGSQDLTVKSRPNLFTHSLSVPSIKKHNFLQSTINPSSSPNKCQFNLWPCSRWETATILMWTNTTTTAAIGKSGDAGKERRGCKTAADECSGRARGRATLRLPTVRGGAPSTLEHSGLMECGLNYSSIYNNTWTGGRRKWPARRRPEAAVTCLSPRGDPRRDVSAVAMATRIHTSHDHPPGSSGPQSILPAGFQTVTRLPRALLSLQHCVYVLANGRGGGGLVGRVRGVSELLSPDTRWRPGTRLNLSPQDAPHSCTHGKLDLSDDVKILSGVVVRLLASHLGKLSSIRGGVAPVFSRVGNVSGGAADFLGDLPFPPPFHSGAAPYLASSSSTLKTSRRPNLKQLITSFRSGYIWAALNINAEERGECGASAGKQPADQRHSPARFPHTCDSTGATRLGIEPGSPRWEASRLTTTPPSLWKRKVGPCGGWSRHCGPTWNRSIHLATAAPLGIALSTEPLRPHLESLYPLSHCGPTWNRSIH